MKRPTPAASDPATDQTTDADGAGDDVVPVDRATARRHPLFGMSGWTGIAVVSLALAPLLSLLNVGVTEFGAGPVLQIGLRDFTNVPAPLQGLPAADFVIIGSCLLLSALLFLTSPYLPLLFGCFTVFVVLPYAGVLAYLGYVAQVATPLELLGQVNVAAVNVLWLPYMLWSRRIDITCRRRLRRSDPWAAPLLTGTTDAAADATAGPPEAPATDEQPASSAAPPVDLPAALIDSTRAAREMGRGGKLYGWYGDGRFGGRPPSFEERHRYEQELTQSIHNLALFQQKAAPPRQAMTPTAPQQQPPQQAAI